jgi:hypothetical protein
LEEQRSGLDFEIEDLVKEIDMESNFNKQEKQMLLSEVKPDSKLGRLMSMIRERDEEIKK